MMTLPMRAWSSEQSIDARMPTVFALLETAIAITLSLWVATATNSILHIAVGSCFVPLLLMRSSESTALGKRLFAKGLPRKQWSDQHIVVPLVLVYVLILSLVVRILATLRHPIKGVHSIPDNWNRVVLCTDALTPLSLVPGTGRISEVLEEALHENYKNLAHLPFQFLYLITYTLLAVATHVWVRDWFDNFIWKGIAVILENVFALWAIISIIGIFCFVVAYFYRLSLKSTALLWMPLIYVVRVSFDTSLPLSLKLNEIRKSALWKIVRGLSWVTLIFLAWKVLVLPQTISWWNAQPWTNVLDVYVMPNKLHLWHLAAGTNAMLALAGYYLLFERASRYLAVGAWSESRIELAIQSFSFFRGIISIYTIAVGIYLTTVTALSMAWPEWSWKLFPV